VDDDKGFAKACAHVLAGWGYDVRTALTGEEALQLLQSQSFDVLLCDIYIPKIDGLAILRAAREKDGDMPVILMTGTPGVETAREAVELGVQGYLIKPLPLPQLQEMLERSVRQVRVARAQRLLLDSSAHTIRENEALRQHYDAAIQNMWMAFQPIVSWSNKTVVAYEALLRTRAPVLSQPALVISAAETLGEMHNLGLKTRSIIADIMGNHPNLPGVFINLHVLDLLDEQLYLPESPLAPYANCIHFEITERMAIEKVPDTHERINRLRKLGYKIAIDDLGEGYSGLNSLAELEPDAVKLDMSLIRGIDHAPTKRKMVRALARLCRDLGTHAIAEGVETTAECESLVELGVDWLQGFLFAHPDFPFPIPRM
jgi:EAL domain-containing protein (putative c-di-GMP-specific phosphodiesterase class I)